MNFEILVVLLLAFTIFPLLYFLIEEKEKRFLFFKNMSLPFSLLRQFSKKQISANEYIHRLTENDGYLLETYKKK